MPNNPWYEKRVPSIFDLYPPPPPPPIEASGGLSPTPEEIAQQKAALGGAGVGSNEWGQYKYGSPGLTEQQAPAGSPATWSPESQSWVGGYYNEAGERIALSAPPEGFANWEDYWGTQYAPRPEMISGNRGGTTATYGGHRTATERMLYNKALVKTGGARGWQMALLKDEVKRYKAGELAWEDMTPWVRMLILQGQHKFGQPSWGPHNPPPTVPPHTPAGGGGGTTATGGPMVTWRP